MRCSTVLLPEPLLPLDSDPAKITPAIIGYSDIRLFDLPVSIKRSQREEGKLIIHSHKKRSKASHRTWLGFVALAIQLALVAAALRKKFGEPRRNVSARAADFTFGDGAPCHLL